jgi:hypothetical protein
MLKWQDPLTGPVETRLKTLAHDLRRLKPEGWSVVLSANEIIVRPQDRTAGKFSITFVSGAKCAVSFFSRELNCWNKSKYFDPNASLAGPIKEWMESAATEPLKIDNADWQVVDRTA